MRIIELEPKHVKVQCSDEAMCAVAADPEWLRTHAEMRDVPILLTSHAKAYNRGGGWWDIMGYANDASDVRVIVDKLRTISE